MQDKKKLIELFSLDNKIAIVTGASRGIGFALANGLAMAGATVIAIARSPQPKTAFQHNVHYLSADLSGKVNNLFEDIASTYGAIDILVNSLGISLSTGSTSEENLLRFKQTLHLNLITSYACCLAAQPFMLKGSSIINITSIGSVLGFPDNPGYVAAKGGLRMMTKALAVDYGRLGIRVNALAPGYIHTDMTAKSFSEPEQHKRRQNHTCVDRWGCVEDLVGATIFLASDASSYMTGQDLVIDGGWTAKGLV